MTGNQVTDPVSSWNRQRERFHRARTVRLLLPGIAPLVLAALVAGGVVGPPRSALQGVSWVIAALAYGVVWVFLIRDARRFVDLAAELDERYRVQTGDVIERAQPLPFTPPSYPPPMPVGEGGGVVAVAGRRIDARHAEVARFPLASVGEVRERLGELFARLRPSAVVCSAACGVDLLALDAAQSLGIRRRVLLPFDRARFRQTSVTDRAGNWGRLYDRVLDGLAPGDLIVLPDLGEDVAAYRAANDAILDHAAALAVARAAEPGAGAEQPEVIAVVVWEGRPRGGDDITALFRDEAVRRGIPVEQLSTL